VVIILTRRVVGSMCDGLHIDLVSSCIVIDGNVHVCSSETLSPESHALPYLNRATLVCDTLGDVMVVGDLLQWFFARQAMNNAAKRQSASPGSGAHSFSKFLHWQVGGKVWKMTLIFIATIVGFMCPQVARRRRKRKLYRCSGPLCYSSSEGKSRNLSTESSAPSALAPEGGPLRPGELDCEDQDDWLQWTPNQISSAGVASAKQPEQTPWDVVVKTPPQYQQLHIRNHLLPEDAGCEDTDALVCSSQQQQQKQRQQLPPLQHWQVLKPQQVQDKLPSSFWSGAAPDMHDPKNVFPDDHISDDSDNPASRSLERRRRTMPDRAIGCSGFVWQRAQELNIFESPPVFPLLNKLSDTWTGLEQDEPPHTVSMTKEMSNASRPGFVRRRSQELENIASFDQRGSP